jgi:LacI family transcriptional regulator
MHQNENEKDTLRSLYRIYLAFTHNNGMMYDLLKGISAYGNQQSQWRFGIWRYESEPPEWPVETDALIGKFNIEMLKNWSDENCRKVINVSRACFSDRIAHVICDDYQIGKLAAEYLVNKGLHVFAYCGEPNERAKGFSDYIQQCDLPYQSFRPVSKEKGRLKIWLSKLPRRTGIFTFNDIMAGCVLWSAQSAGRIVPEDLAVVGVDNDHLQSLLSPTPITSVDANFVEVGRQAAELLHRILDDHYDARGERITIAPNGVIERMSSDFPGICDRMVVRAARYIQQNACKGHNVEDVINAVPLSRRPLERRFQEAFGRTLLQEIQRVRMGEAARLLTDTYMPLNVIAERCGYKSNPSFTRVFQRVMGQSPGSYRKQHSNTT